jgi:hypothetical protein
MKTLAASAIVLVTLCAPALGDPAGPPDSLKIRFALRDTTTTHFDVIVAARGPCATARHTHPGREIQLTACMADATQLTVEWLTRTGASEYRSTSSVPAVRGAVTELGTTTGPRLTVTVQ